MLKSDDALQDGGGGRRISGGEDAAVQLLGPPIASSSSDSRTDRNNNNDDDAATNASASAFTGTYCCTTGTTNDLGTAVTGGEFDSESGGLKHTHVGKVTDDALRQFDEAMSLVDPATKEGWTRAQARCSSIVLRHECCPCYFILACQFNPWDAASRMCSYWKERIHLFGDRAYEAMTLGSGTVPPTCLTKDDVRIIETGTFVVLPKDRKGRAVLFVDEERMEPYMLDQPSSRLRALWYMHHANFTSGGDNAHRLVTLYSCFSPPSSGQYSRAIWQYSAGTIRFISVLPIVVDAIHLLTLPTKTGRGKLIQFVVTTSATMFWSYLSGLTKAHHGTAERCSFRNTMEEEEQAKADLFKKLTGEGFTKKGLPDWGGGSFGLQDFQSWLKRRRRFEQRAFWTPEQLLEHRRSLNKVHSRQKRRRRNQELTDMQEQVNALQSANTRARVVHDYLEQLVAAALEIVSQHPEQTAIPLTQGLTDGIGWDYGSHPNVLSESSEDTYRRSIMASLEPDPIAHSSLPSATRFTGTHGTRIAAPPMQLSVRGGDQVGALRAPSTAGDERSSVRGKDTFSLTSYRAAMPQQDSYATLSSALLHNVSSTGDSLTSYFTGDMTVRPLRPEANAMGHLTASDDSMALSLQRVVGSLSGGGGAGVAFGAPALDPTDSSHTALLLRSMLRQHQQLVSDLHPHPSGRGQLPQFAPTQHEDCIDPRRDVIRRRSALPSAPSAPFQPSSSAAAMLNLLQVQNPSTSGGGGDPPSRSDRRWSGRGSVGDDGRVDASSLFDQDWL